MRLCLTLCLLFSISLYAQNFFPIKTGDKIQYRLVENGSVSGGFYRESFNKSIITETEYQGKTYVNFINGLFRYDSLNQKLYRLINYSEKLAYDFNKSAGETDTLFIDGFSNVWTYSETVYPVFGQDRIIKSIFRQYAQYQDTQEWKYVFAEGLGLYNKYYYHEFMYDYIQSSETMISAIIDSTIYNPLTLSITATIPDCISAVNNQFYISCNIYAEYAGLVDTLKAEINIISDNNVLYTGVFYRSGESGPIAVNLPSALLVPPHSVNIRVICKDKSIFENVTQFPDTGYLNTPCQSSCGELWSVINVPYNWQYSPYLTMKFFNKNRGRIVIQPSAQGSPLWDTNDGGYTWQLWNIGNYYKDKNFQMIDTLYSYILTESFAGTIFKTTDGGNTFDINYSRDGNTNYSLSFINRTHGWVAVNYRYSPTSYAPAILKTTNGGTNWEVIPVNLGSQLKEIDFVDTNIGWLQTENGNFYKSIDGGINWSQISSIPLFNIVYMQDTLTGWAIGSGVGRTTDGGITWIKQVSGNFRDAVFFDSNSGWVLGKDSLFQRAVLYTANGGASWVSQDVGVTNNCLLIDFISRTHGWILCDGYVLLKTVDSGITFVSEEASETPNDFYISQNYPNPFNPITTIRYEIPTRSNVNISVFNILGEMVSVLVNEIQESDEYEIKFDASLLPSGVYIYRISTESYTHSQKMVLLK